MAGRFCSGVIAATFGDGAGLFCGPDAGTFGPNVSPGAEAAAAAWVDGAPAGAGTDGLGAWVTSAGAGAGGAGEDAGAGAVDAVVAAGAAAGAIAGAAPAGGDAVATAAGAGVAATGVRATGDGAPGLESAPEAPWPPLAGEVWATGSPYRMTLSVSAI